MSKTAESQTGHTSGPWRMNGQRVEYGPVVAGDGFCVAVILRDPAEAEANGRLVAAAPELLRELKRLEIQGSHANQLQHAGVELGPEIWSDLYESCNAARAAIAKAT